ncbi:MAG: hypothetical protein KBG48_14040 [Kofleriaceae bacterium]|jgi:hypothetical protein|nr:hypothetical protein [Kofleriaceae bacterium]MBP9168511.1 hypothetical protein [Kofleriaceae bacterium]MBP9859724.1 hypothetical protein [Kofleriaceae bacterium]
MTTRLFVTALLFAGVAACTETAPVDEFATEETGEIDESKADLGGTYTFFEIKRDYRRCVSPLCGGYWVSRVNRTTTKCADGSYQPSCYMAEVRWDRLGLGAPAMDELQAAIDGSSVLVRGTVGKKDFGGQFGQLGEFRPTEAWIGQGPNPPAGPFAMVEESGVRCITTPCNFWREKKLNASTTASLAELGWESSGADDERVGRAISEIFERNLIIAGDRYTVRGPGGTGKARTVSQFYVRARDKKACFVGGCSGQLCSDRPGAISTCEYRPEYACYQDAVCEEQIGGECGWTETDALAACLADPSAP